MYVLLILDVSIMLFIFTCVLGRISGSAGILARISHRTIPKENTST